MPRGGANLIDVVGFRYGRALVLARGTNTAAGKAKWVCRCDCGKEFEAGGADLRNGKTKSCGCGKADALLAANTSHGHAARETRTYNTWKGLTQRCRDQNVPSYKYYGGRGIRVCERWSDYRNFLADMGEAPPGLSIDRIDNNGNYEPGNCRWATWDQQMANKRQRGKSTAPPTHCRRGHEYTEESTRWSKRMSRACRICDRESHRAARSQLRAAEVAQDVG